MRQRVEDLGRLSVLVRNLLDHELFEDGILRPRRPKDYAEWFESKTDDQKDDILRAWAYGIENISNKLHEMLAIAKGTDDLNETTCADESKSIQRSF